MAVIPEAIIEHYRLMQILQLTGLKTARKLWGKINPDNISETWAKSVEQLEPVMAGLQQRAAISAAASVYRALATQGTPIAAEWALDFNAFGYGNTALLYHPAITALTGIRDSLTVDNALALGRASLDRITTSQISGAGLDASQVEIAARPTVRYVRMVNPPSCARCIILAGRIYTWNEGFARHPRCDCRHIPTTIGDQAEALANGLIDDPAKVFAQMDSAQIAALEKSLGKASVAALREGADWSQVVNAKRGMSKNGNFTVEGTSNRGYAGSLLKPGQRRATPSLLLEWADGDRAKFKQLLTEHGYLLPDGLVLHGRDYEGFGQMGRGGTRKAATDAVLDARETGIRDPMNRYTMTAAERREYDAAMRAKAIAEGRNPYASPVLDHGEHKTPDPYGWRTVGGLGSHSAAGIPAPNPADLARYFPPQTPTPAAGGNGQKPPTSRRVGGAMDENLPDEYATPGVPFTRSTRPLADYGTANHALEEHHAEAPIVEGKHYFPPGYFGSASDDQISAAKKLIDTVTYRAEPIEVGRGSQAWNFISEVDGVLVRVPVAYDEFGNLRPHTAIPILGDGVTVGHNGIRIKLQ